jgi:hypothetical protein
MHKRVSFSGALFCIIIVHATFHNCEAMIILRTDPLDE